MRTMRLFLIGMIVTFSFTSPAQLLTNNSALISITTTGQLTVKGDVLNNAGGTITNNATLDLTGDWINNSGNNCFGTSNGTVILNGTNQVIRGNSQTVFNNLNLIGGTKTLEINTTTGGAYAIPTGILNCNNAVLNLNSNMLTISNPNPSAILNTTGYILSEDADNSSKVTWEIGTTSGLHTIPFGNAGAFQIPYSINISSGNLGEVTVSTYQTIPNNTPYPLTPLLVTHVQHVSGTDNSANTVDRFWQVDKTGAGTATYTFTYAPSENASNGNTNLRAQCWQNVITGWGTAIAGQSNPNAQSVSVPGVNISGAWALALSSSPLPVELLSFSATPKDNKNVICNWNTASEINNDYFTVMRSKDGHLYEELGIVEGAGNSNKLLNYTYTDKNPHHGTSYYRLKQTDFNGAASYSKTVSVELPDAGINYVVYPNPSAGSFYIRYNAVGNLNSNYTIMDAAGRTVCTGHLQDLSGIQRISIRDVMKGYYILKISNSASTFCSRLSIIE